MDLFSSIKDQFLDVIEYEEPSSKILVYKYVRPSGNNELKQGSKVIVRESQAAAFLKAGKIADVLSPGTHTLNTENMPVLSTLKAFPFLFTSPVIADLYYVSTKQFLDLKWATKNPVIKRDHDLNMVRVRAFGNAAFRVVDVEKFMTEFFGTLGLVLTYDIMQYLSSILIEAFATVVGESQFSILEFAAQYRNLSSDVQRVANEKATKFGISFSEIIIENISLPDEVEKLIDEQSGIKLAKDDMNSFMQYQTARAMRDAAKQEGGLAGLGAGMALGGKMAETISETTVGEDKPKGVDLEHLRNLKTLLDEGILTQEEFDEQKKKMLK
jgi:Putative virion core protein (lumpy skin disease virus)